MCCVFVYERFFTRTAKFQRKKLPKKAPPDLIRGYKTEKTEKKRKEKERETKKKERKERRK